MLDCACQGCTLYRHNNVKSFFDARNLYKQCMSEVLRLNKQEKKEYFLSKISAFQVRVTPSQKHKFVYTVGSAANQHVVCRKGFTQAYTITKWYLDDVIQRFKSGHKNVAKDLSEKTLISRDDVGDKRLSAFAEEFGVSLTPEQLGNLRMANTFETKLCSAWMQYYFSLVGDKCPSAHNEIHLEPIPKEEVYKEYCFDSEHILHQEPISLNVFRQVWKNVFPHVKIRKYKSSCGHCNLCSILSEKRRKFGDRRGREEITNLFALHRMSTMGERRTYYDRRLKAEMDPSLYLSTIADGMQQNHCMLPWYGNTKTPANHVKQHLQGVYMHGDNMTIYRTFANVGGGANLAIHTWLLSLENLSRCRSGRLPKVLYHQIDGGPENANVEFLAVCHLLVACGIFEKIVLTRLPVGHTHEDIDALFALIWKRLRDEHIYTVEDFAKMVCQVLNKKVRVNVVDLYAVPDYVSMFADCVDPSVGRFSKEEWAQLQFTFESVEVSDAHPTGVKTSYRAYTQDTYIEIVEDDKDQTICGLIPQECVVQSRPLPGEPLLNVLKSFPRGRILPAPFIAGSRDLIDNVSRRMISQYTKGQPAVAESWRIWSQEIFPLSDNVQDYLTTHCGVHAAHSLNTDFILDERNKTECGIYLPFKMRMFCDMEMSNCHVGPRQRGPRDQSSSSRATWRGGESMRVVESTTCVIHEENKSAAARRTGSRNVILEATGQAPAEPKTTLNNVYPGREERRAGQALRRLEAKQAKQEAKHSAAVTESDCTVPPATVTVPAATVPVTELRADAKTTATESAVAVPPATATVPPATATVPVPPATVTVPPATMPPATATSLKRASAIAACRGLVSSKRQASSSRGKILLEVVTEGWQDTGAVSNSNVCTGKRIRHKRVNNY